jgi:hypothetical protein
MGRVKFSRDVGTGPLMAGDGLARCMDSKTKKVTGKSKSKSTSKQDAIANGFTDITRNNGTIIITGEHVAKMWKASQTKKSQG